MFRDRIELTGSLLGQLEEAYSFIERYNRTRAEFQGLERIDMRDYPPEAIREALLNAIVHREYSYRGSILISIFDNRIEFVTIGGLVNGITIEDIMLGVSVPRNEHLAGIFDLLKLIEAYGTGILKINDSYGQSSAKPKISVSDNAFKIMLPNTNIRESNEIGQSVEIKRVPTVLEKRESAVLRMLDETEYVVRKDVQEALLVSQATAILLLREMTDKGLIVREGSGKYLCYKLNETK
ncbi:ATP-binding protein [Youngiibacter fragilis]|uniref:ATP-binding protein n=1 Tax=Youngiibacter fragilis TaxID=1408819 RepID=UPI00042697ED